MFRTKLNHVNKTSSYRTLCKSIVTLVFRRCLVSKTTSCRASISFTATSGDVCWGMRANSRTAIEKILLVLISILSKNNNQLDKKWMLFSVTFIITFNNWNSTPAKSLINNSINTVIVCIFITNTMYSTVHVWSLQVFLNVFGKKSRMLTKAAYMWSKIQEKYSCVKITIFYFNIFKCFFFLWWQNWIYSRYYSSLQWHRILQKSF